jgi:hypothetical protein
LVELAVAAVPTEQIELGEKQQGLAQVSLLSSPLSLLLRA